MNNYEQEIKLLKAENESLKSCIKILSKRRILFRRNNWFQNVCASLVRLSKSYEALSEKLDSNYLSKIMLINY